MRSNNLLTQKPKKKKKKGLFINGVLSAKINWTKVYSWFAWEGNCSLKKKKRKKNRLWPPNSKFLGGGNNKETHAPFVANNEPQLGVVCYHLARASVGQQDLSCDIGPKPMRSLWYSSWAFEGQSTQHGQGVRKRIARQFARGGWPSKGGTILPCPPLAVAVARRSSLVILPDMALPLLEAWTTFLVSGQLHLVHLSFATICFSSSFPPSSVIG